MKNILHITAILILVFVTNDLTAQQRRRPTLSFGAQVSQPRGQFGHVYDGYPAGLAGSFVGPLGNSPFEVGFGLAWNSMGSQDEDVSAFVGTDMTGDSIYEEGTMRIRSNNNRFQLIGRFRPFNGMIQPYGEALAGFDMYKTKTDITLNGNGYTEANNDIRQHFDLTYNIGWAAGLRVRIAPNVFVDGRFENLLGGPASYVNQESIQVVDESKITFETLESHTDRYTYQLGITIGF
jgi:hypothetical protein